MPSMSQCLGFSTGCIPDSSLLLTYTLESSRWWLKQLGSRHPQGRSGLTSGLTVLALVRTRRWGMSQEVEDLSPLSLFLIVTLLFKWNEKNLKIKNVQSSSVLSGYWIDQGILRTCPSFRKLYETEVLYSTDLCLIWIFIKSLIVLYCEVILAESRQHWLTGHSKITCVLGK